MNKKVPAHEVHKGWWVSNHAVLRFQERASSSGSEIKQMADWLRLNAHKAHSSGVRTRNGRVVFILETPFCHRKAALIVNRSQEGIMAVVSCGWWDDTPPSPRRVRRSDVRSPRGSTPRMMAPVVETLPLEVILRGKERRKLGLRG